MTIKPENGSLTVGATLQLTAEASNASGTILTDKTITWVSSRPDIATITSRGLVTGIATGTTMIAATSGGRSKTRTLAVYAPNRIVLTSDFSDYIGGGATYTYTNANAEVLVSAGPSTVLVRVSGDQRWTGTFQTPNNAPLEVRTYSDAARLGFSGNGTGMEWEGESRGCNMLTGSFTIDSLKRIPGASPGRSLAAIDMTFEQHCEGAPSALHGAIHWRVDDPTVPPGPVVPIPTDLWQPPTGSTPTTGDFIYLEPREGPPVLFQGTMAINAAGAHVEVSAFPYTGFFEGMSSVSEMKVGYYGDLMRSPFSNPARGSLDWFGNGYACATVRGWFAVDRVSYVNGALAGIELRFEHRCETNVVGLHGALRWGTLPN